MTFQNYIFHHFHTVANFPSQISHYINISSLDVEVEAKIMKPSPKIKTIKPDVNVDLTNLSGKIHNFLNLMKQN